MAFLLSGLWFARTQRLQSSFGTCLKRPSCVLFPFVLVLRCSHSVCTHVICFVLQTRIVTLVSKMFVGLHKVGLIGGKTLHRTTFVPRKGSGHKTTSNQFVRFCFDTIYHGLRKSKSYKTIKLEHVFAFYVVALH